MPQFEYKAIDTKGKVVMDIIQAGNRDAAAASIVSDGLQVLTIREIKGGISFLSTKRLSVDDKANFCRFMATMIRSGLSVPEAIDIIRQEAESKRMKSILADLAQRTRRGESLGSVFAQYPSDFDPIFLTIIKVGEETGNLEKSFDYLAKQLYASHQMSQKVKGALMYPAVIVSAMMGVGLMMVVGVLPKISAVFLKMKVPLPTMTKFILTFGTFVGKNVGVFIGGLILSIFIVFMLFKINSTRKVLMTGITKLPLINKLVKQIDVARFARTLSTLLKSGVPIISALNVSAEGVTQKKMKELAIKFSEDVGKGESLSEVLMKNKGVFPVIMTQTVRAGEKSGTLEKILEEMADFYEGETEEALKRLVTLLEPLMMLAIGIAVGAMVIMLIAPIYSIVGGLQQTIQK